MASALTIDISATRAITATGRLVAGETATISIVGAEPSKMYLINAQREVIAYCDEFESASGSINLATVQISDIIAGMPAGRACSVSCIIEDANDNIVGYGFVPLVSAPMPSELENVSVDLYLRASTIRQLFADIPETYANQRSISSALSQVVNILKTIGLAACVAFTALATEWQDVPADTIIGEGLTLTNGTISAAGGGLDGQAVTNIVEGIVADATNRVVRADQYGNVTIQSFLDVGDTITLKRGGNLSLTSNPETHAAELYGGEWRYTPFNEYGPGREIAVKDDLAPIVQLLTNRLTGVTFDFATVAGLYLAISNIVAAQGGAITNFPAIP